MLHLSAEETRGLLRRIYKLEIEVAIGKSSIQKTVETTKELYANVQRIEGEVRKYLTYMMLSGMAVPGVATAFGPYFILIPLIIDIATGIAEMTTRLEILKLRREIEEEMREFNEKLVIDAIANSERERRECWRTVQP